MKRQTGARFLHRLQTRSDETYNGIIKLINHNPKQYRNVKLSSRIIKRVRVTA